MGLILSILFASIFMVGGALASWYFRAYMPLAMAAVGVMMVGNGANGLLWGWFVTVILALGVISFAAQLRVDEGDPRRSPNRERVADVSAVLSALVALIYQFGDDLWELVVKLATSKISVPGLVIAVLVTAVVTWIILGLWRSRRNRTQAAAQTQATD